MAVAFIDGQNLFHGAREAFGYQFPNYDANGLARAVCEARGWVVSEVRFYTGVPEAADDPRWHAFWAAKMAVMGRQKVHLFHRPVRYRTVDIKLPRGKIHTFRAGEEKGIDVRIAIDVIRMAHHQRYDVGVIFSQDQDLSEVAEEVRVISMEQRRWIKVASAFPDDPAVAKLNHRGINNTDWIPIDKATYDAHLDTRDYRPPIVNRPAP